MSALKLSRCLLRRASRSVLVTGSRCPTLSAPLHSGSERSEAAVAMLASLAEMLAACVVVAVVSWCLDFELLIPTWCSFPN